MRSDEDVKWTEEVRKSNFVRGHDSTETIVEELAEDLLGP